MKRMSFWLFAGLILGLSGCCGAKQCLMPCQSTCVLKKLGTCLADKKAKLCHLKAHLCNKHKACMATKCGLPHCGAANCGGGGCGTGLCETSVYASPQGVVASPQGIVASPQGMPLPYPSPQYGLPFYGVPGYNAGPAPMGTGQAPVGAVPPPPLTQPTSYVPGCSGDPASCANNVASAGRVASANGYCNHCGRGGSDSDQVPPPPAVSVNTPPIPGPSADAASDHERASAPLQGRPRAHPRVGVQGALRTLDDREPMASHRHNRGGVREVEVIPAAAEAEEDAPSEVIHLEDPTPARGRTPLGANGTGAGRPAIALEHEAVPDRAVRPVPRNVTARGSRRDPVMGWAANLSTDPADPDFRPARLVPRPRTPQRSSVVGQFFQKFQSPDAPRIVERSPHTADPDLHSTDER